MLKLCSPEIIRRYGSITETLCSNLQSQLHFLLLLNKLCTLGKLVISASKVPGRNINSLIPKLQSSGSMYVYIKFTICNSSTLQKSCFCPLFGCYTRCKTLAVKQLKIHNLGNVMEKHKNHTYPRENNEVG